MKIVFLYNSVFTLGGIQRCVTVLANYLCDKHHDVTIMCTSRKTPIDRAKYGLSPNVRIIFAEPISHGQKALAIFRRPLKKINDLTGCFKHNRLMLEHLYYPYRSNSLRTLQREQPDVAIACDTHSAMLASFSKLKAIRIGWQHNNYDDYFKTPRKKYWNQDAIVANMREQLDGYVVLMSQDAEKLKAEWNLHATVIHDPLSFTQPQKSRLTNKKILAVGRLTHAKGFDMLLEAFAIFHKKMPTWQLDIVGDGPEKNKLQNQIQKLGLANVVHLLGQRTDLKDIYRSSSIFCFSSRYEGFGMVLTEAMESGLPIISFNIPQTEFIVGDNGILIDHYDTKKMAMALSDMASSMKSREHYAKKSIARAQDFSIERIGTIWEQYLSALVSKKQRKKS